MKRTRQLLSLILVAAVILSMTLITATAEDETPQTPELPQIRVTTELGNGTTLQKADDYQNAEITITDTDGSMLSGAVLFKVRGNTTAMPTVRKKAYTFKFDKKQNVLGMGKGKKWAMLANAFDPTLLRNYIAIEIARHFGLAYTSEQKFVELWVDQSYRGLYTLMEPVQEGKERVNIDIESNNGKQDFLLEYERLLDEEDVSYLTSADLRFAVKEPEEPDEEQLAYIQGIMDDIVGAIRSGSREAIEEKIDLDSFVRFYLLNEFYKTYDFNTSSVYYYYQDGKLHAGPAWDYDLSTGNSLDTYPRGRNTCYPTGIGANQQVFSYLCKYDWFEEEVKKAYRDNYLYLQGISAEGGLMDELIRTYRGAIDRNFAPGIWRVSQGWINIQHKPFATYDENVNYLRSWLSERAAWLRDHYGVYLKGDADGNGEINILDATRVQQILVEIQKDEDGKATERAKNEERLNIIDATAIQRTIAGFESTYPIGEPTLYQ